jgi:hypothetical protein
MRLFKETIPRQECPYGRYYRDAPPRLRRARIEYEDCKRCSFYQFLIFHDHEVYIKCTGDIKHKHKFIGSTI